MNNIADIQKFWNDVLVGKTITKATYDNVSLTGFFLSDGTKVGYDYEHKGLFVATDNKTGETVKYS